MADGMKKVKVSVFFDKIPKKYKFSPVQILDKKIKNGYNINLRKDNILHGRDFDALCVRNWGFYEKNIIGIVWVDAVLTTSAR